MRTALFRTILLGIGLTMIPGFAYSDDGDKDKAKKIEAKAAKADIYNPKADAREQLAQAISKANQDHKRVLLMFGGNWCGWCHKLHDVFKSNAKVAKLLRYEYELALIDTAAPHAEELFEELKGDPKAGVPFLIVVDGQGKPVVQQETGSLEEGDHHDPAKVEAFLVKWKHEPVDAKVALEDAFKRASSQDKMVFLHFGAPWCGWCHRLENFMARDEVAKILGQDFVDLKVDMDRATGADEISKQFRETEKGGIPWFVFLDAQGKAIVNSDGPNGNRNIGFPVEPQEIEWFVEMLKKSAKKIDANQIKRIEALLKEEAAKIKAPPVSPDSSTFSQGQ